MHVVDIFLRERWQVDCLDFLRQFGYKYTTTIEPSKFINLKISLLYLVKNQPYRMSTPNGVTLTWPNQKISRALYGPLVRRYPPLSESIRYMTSYVWEQNNLLPTWFACLFCFSVLFYTLVHYWLDSAAKVDYGRPFFETSFNHHGK